MLVCTSSSQLVDKLRSYWTERYGFVCVKEISRDMKSFQNSARYLAKYTAKSVLTSSDDKRFRIGMIRPFIVHSRNWGDSFLDKFRPLINELKYDPLNFNFDSFFDSLKVSFNGYEYKLPKYYQDRLLDEVFSQVSEGSTQLLKRYKRALERFRNISAVRSSLNLTYGEASKIVDSKEMYYLASRKSEDIASTENRLRSKRLESYAKDKF